MRFHANVTLIELIDDENCFKMQILPNHELVASWIN